MTRREENRKTGENVKVRFVFTVSEPFCIVKAENLKSNFSVHSLALITPWVRFMFLQVEATIGNLGRFLSTVTRDVQRKSESVNYLQTSWN